jgi:hypothetical protein
MSEPCEASRQPPRLTDYGPDAGEITCDMISAGAEAYRTFDPDVEEPEALVFAIIYRAFEIARRNRVANLASQPE